jgi:hypothetical protein
MPHNFEQRRQRYKKLTRQQWPQAIQFLARLDADSLRHRLKCFSTVRTILNHFNGPSDENALLFAGIDDQMFALIEIYATQPDWNSAELAITTQSHIIDDQVFGELSQLAIFELTKLGTVELILSRAHYEKLLARYFDQFPVIAIDDSKIILSFLDTEDVDPTPPDYLKQ